MPNGENGISPRTESGYASTRDYSDDDDDVQDLPQIKLAVEDYDTDCETTSETGSERSSYSSRFSSQSVADMVPDDTFTPAWSLVDGTPTPCSQSAVEARAFPQWPDIKAAEMTPLWQDCSGAWETSPVTLSYSSSSEDERVSPSPIQSGKAVSPRAAVVCDQPPIDAVRLNVSVNGGTDEVAAGHLDIGANGGGDGVAAVPVLEKLIADADRRGCEHRGTEAVPAFDCSGEERTPSPQPCSGGSDEPALPKTFVSVAQRVRFFEQKCESSVPSRHAGLALTEGSERGRVLAITRQWGLA